MSDAGIIGSRDLVDMFKLLGVEVYPAERASDAKDALARIVEEKRLKVVFILESLAREMREEIRRTEDLDTLTVVPLPDHAGEVSYLDDELRRLSKGAIGMEI